MTNPHPFEAASPHDEPDEVRVDTDARSGRYRWNVGHPYPEHGERGGRPFQDVAELSVYHDKDRKRFTATLQRASLGDGFVRRTIRLGREDPLRSVQVLARPVARYSRKAFVQFAQDALAELREVSEHPAVQCHFSAEYKEVD